MPPPRRSSSYGSIAELLSAPPIPSDCQEALISLWIAGHRCVRDMKGTPPLEWAAMWGGQNGLERIKDKLRQYKAQQARLGHKGYPWFLSTLERMAMALLEELIVVLSLRPPQELEYSEGPWRLENLHRGLEGFERLLEVFQFARSVISPPPLPDILESGQVIMEPTD